MVVDVHGHITHPELLRRFPMPPALGDIEGMIERKAAEGIDLTIVGSPVGFGTMMPVEGLDNFAQPLDRLRSFHEWLAETVREHPGRLAAYVYTNPFGGDEMLKQTAETLRIDGFVGLIVNTSVRGEYLDGEGADPFFEMAAELDVPVFLHPPAEPVGSESFSAFPLVEQVARFDDVTACLATLLLSDRLARHPSLRLLAAMAGGAIALLPARLDAAHRMKAARGGPGGGPPGEAAPGPLPSELLRRIHVDTATSSMPALLAGAEVLGPGQMLFGTDSPPTTTPLDEALAMVERLPVSDEERRGVLGGNAVRLFGLAA